MTDHTFPSIPLSSSLDVAQGAPHAWCADNHQGQQAALVQKRAEQRELLAQARQRRLAWASPHGTTYEPSRWAHVPLLTLLREFGYSLTRSGSSAYETAHAAHPVSKSGRNMVIWPAEGRAYCRKCGRVYDAPALVMEQLGISFRAAADWLSARYGPPKGWRSGGGPTPPKPGSRSISWTVRR